MHKAIKASANATAKTIAACVQEEKKAVWKSRQGRSTQMLVTRRVTPMMGDRSSMISSAPPRLALCASPCRSTCVMAHRRPARALAEMTMRNPAQENSPSSSPSTKRKRPREMIAMTPARRHDIRSIPISMANRSRKSGVVDLSIV